MTIFVLDCSVAMSWCFEDETTDKSKNLLKLFAKQKALVPSIWSLEVLNVLHYAEQHKRITQKDSELFINLLDELPIEVDIGLSTLFNKMTLKLARSHKLSIYDAAYLELSIRYGAPFASFDKKLCSAAKKENITIL